MLTSPKLTGLVLLIVPAVVVPIIVLGRRLRSLSRENQDWIATSSGSASESLLAVQTVQAFTHEGETRRAFADVTAKSLASAQKRVSTRAVMTVIVIFLVFSGIVGVLWIGARDVRAGQMSVGELIQFVIYAVMVAGAVGALSEIWGELMRAAGRDRTAGRASEHRRHGAGPGRAQGAAAPGAGRDRVPRRDLPLSRPARGFGAERRVADRAARRDGGAGWPFGSGQDHDPAVADAVLRPAGRPRHAGRARPAPAGAWRFPAAIALVPQDPVIFAASARDNIRFGRPEASDAEVEAAARAAAAHDFLAALPQGYDTFLGERG